VQIGESAVCNYATQNEADAAAQAAAQANDRASGSGSKGHSGTRSGFKGVSAAGSRWTAVIGYDGSRHYIGTFDTKEEAAAAYDKEARLQIGESAVCNYTTQNEADAAAQAAAQAKDREWAAGGGLTMCKRCNIRKQTRERPYGYCSQSCRDSETLLFSSQGWRVQMFYNGSTHHIGTFATKEGATDAYDKAAAIARRCDGAVQQQQQQQQHEEEHKEEEQQQEEWEEEEDAASHAVNEAPLSGGVGRSLKRARVELVAEQEGAAGVGRGAAAAGQTAGQAPAASGRKGYSGFRGVSADGYRWRALIRYDGSQHYIGSFDTKEEAAAAYDKEARVQRGESAVCNYATQNEADAAAQAAAQPKMRRRAAELAAQAAAEWAAVPTRGRLELSCRWKPPGVI
jgi:hypothetical protein